MTEENNDNVITFSKACPSCGKIFRLPTISKRLKAALQRLGVVKEYYESLYCSSKCIYDKETEEGLKKRKEFYNMVTREFFNNE